MDKEGERDMTQHHLIAVTGDKGGVGKTTVAILLAEWLMHEGMPVRLKDSDPNQSTQMWLDKCHENQRSVNSEHPAVTIVDCAGTSGSSLIKYIREAHLIVVPFQPHEADLEVVVGWYLSIKGELQERVVFVPNRLQQTLEQREGLKQIREVVAEEGRGKVLPGFNNRPAIYTKVQSGRSENFFSQPLDKGVLTEATHAITSIIAELKGVTYGTESKEKQAVA